MTRIRKISIAEGFITNDIMNYVVGNTAYKDYKIALIEKDGPGYVIKIKNDNDELIPWKEFNGNVAVSIEYDTNYGYDVAI